MVVNLWSGDRQFSEALARIRGAFSAGCLTLPAEKPGNVIVLAFRDQPPDAGWQELEARACALTLQYGLEFGRFVEGLKKANRHDATGFLW
jgi:hypothetical protein